MPGYSQFSIKVSFPTPFPQYLLTLPFFFFYPAFFLNWLNFVYTQPEEICQDKKEIEKKKKKRKLKQMAKLLWHSQTYF